MNKTTNSEKMARDDVFFAFALVAIGVYASHKNIVESDWLGFAGTVSLTVFAGFWLFARIYQLTHKHDDHTPTSHP